MVLTEKSLKNAYIWSTHVKRATIRVNGVEKQVRPSGWQPWANTIAYYPLTSETTVNDMSGNNRNLTNRWWVTFWTHYWISCANITWNSDSPHQNSKYLYWDVTWFPTWAWQRTYNFWMYQDNQATSQNAMYIAQWTAGMNKMVVVLQWRDFSWNVWLTSYWYWSGVTSPIIWEWHNIIITYSWSKFSYYVNGEEKINWVHTVDTSSSLVSIWWTSQEANTWSSFNWCFSSLILEDKERTAQEVANYYNLTKSNYWIS